ncbi:hypothetical protein Q0Y04_20760 [Clostridioides difficile]|nr:hypothetical protein Q0Y04_20760 [Clostridioides difficile]
MKFVSFTEGENECKRTGVFSKDELFIIDVNSLNLSRNFKDLNELIQNVSSEDIIKLKTIINESTFYNYDVFKRERCTVHVPIEKPIHDILCVGVNYKDHLEETQTHFDDSFEEPQKRFILQNV